MCKLASKLGYSPATLYLYYQDKDHLLFSVVDDAFTLIRQELAQASSSTSDPWERLGRVGEAYVQFGLQSITPEFSRASFLWNFYGILATITPIIAMILMVWKPELKRPVQALS